MLDLKFVRENSDAVKTNIANKNESADIDSILALDEKRRNIIGEVESLKSKRNTVSKEIARLKKNKENADDTIAEMKTVSETIKKLDTHLSETETEMNESLSKIPNMVHPDVPVGKTEDDNVFIREWGTPNTEKIKEDHIAIAKRLKLVDFERAAKVSGSGFAFYTGKGAKLERALINFFLDNHINNGYTELFAPFIVNPESMYGTGQLPKMEEDMYCSREDQMYLIPTAEVPLTNFHGGEMLNPADLPIKYCGYSPCFRREAGSYGKETKGLLRVHQFNKVEMVKFVKADESYKELDLLVGEVEELLKALELPYRVIRLCTGDTSFASAMTYDLEVWSPAEQKWLEVSSCSNFESFQARRANIRFKPDPKSKPEFIHTLNGSGLATPRIMVAILENYLQADGSVKVPEVLKQFCGFETL